MVAWFRKIASSLETLWVFTSPTHPNYGPQILSLASICAPKLQHLVMAGVIVSPALHPLAFLSQIKTLVLSDWLMPGGDDVMEVSGLSGLRALEVRFSPARTPNPNPCKRHHIQCNLKAI
jgi:hypothetical protein